MLRAVTDPRTAAQLVAVRGEEIEALLQRLSDVNDAMSRCARGVERLAAWRKSDAVACVAAR